MSRGPDGPLVSRVCRSVSPLAAIKGAPPSSQQGGQPCHNGRRAQPEQLTFGSNGEGGIAGPLGGELTPERGH